MDESGDSGSPASFTAIASARILPAKDRPLQPAPALPGRTAADHGWEVLAVLGNGRADEAARTAVRFTLGYTTTDRDVEIAVDVVRDAVALLRADQGGRRLPSRILPLGLNLPA